MPEAAGLGRVLVTGANGHLGRALVRRLARITSVRAVVRSDRAAETLGPIAGDVDVVVLDYADVDALARAARGCDAAVHLVGILKEGAGARYVDAHEGTSRSLAEAARRVGLARIVTVGILGADPHSPNPCLASRARAEAILLAPPLATTVLRVPMVLGGDDPAVRALRARARARIVVLPRGGASLEQPIDAADVVEAIVAALARPALAGRVLELAGPESLPRRDLVRRAAALVGGRPRVVPVPLAPLRAAAALAARWMDRPPITPAMLDVLEHDDRADPDPACRALGIQLTPLDDTLRRLVASGPREEEPSVPTVASASPPARRRVPRGIRWLPWLITAACFAFLYQRIDAASRHQGSALLPYLASVFERVDWWEWLALMIPYSAAYFVIDSLVVWQVVNWFNARVPYRDILPVRASTYILSILNEQVGKGAMAMYLNRRDGVPGWQVGSSMLFIMFCEFYYLLLWALVGAGLHGSELPEAFRALPWVGLGAALFFTLWWLYFRGTLAPRSRLREREILHAFRRARPWQYGVIILLRSPALLVAVLVYTTALGLFGVHASLGRMLGVMPLIFFGAATPGPMRAVAISMWVLLFPDHPAEMAAFGLVMHNFFVLFNAAIGLLFLRRANRELFAQA
jgi:uncharacterized protein YbjT (DUF2867 family)